MISALEHWRYCPRQRALIHLEQTFDEDVYTLRGRLLHHKVDQEDHVPEPRPASTEIGFERSVTPVKYEEMKNHLLEIIDWLTPGLQAG
jgi:hypothetical protein